MGKITAIIIVLSVILLGAMLFMRPTASGPQLIQTDRTNREVALACDPEMANGFHIHPILEIRINGEKIVVPANIGVRPTCMTALHTHTPDGVVHVESPEERDFTLSDFFAVWEQPFTKDQILDHVADANHRIRITVDGGEVDTFENTILRDGEYIVISYESIQ
jgi:hypothetical protein